LQSVARTVVHRRADVALGAQVLRPIVAEVVVGRREVPVGGQRFVVSSQRRRLWEGGWLGFDTCNGARVEHVEVAGLCATGVRGERGQRRAVLGGAGQKRRDGDAHLLDAVPARQGGRACVSQPIKRVEALPVPRN